MVTVSASVTKPSPLVHKSERELPTSQARPVGDPVRDADIRSRLDALLQQQHSGEPDTIIRHEMSLCGWKRRIDIATLNGEFSGYEIKSDRDTLSRLPGQADLYGRVFDRVTLVVAGRHHKQALDLVPDWWGIVVARHDGDCVILEPEREPAINTSLDAHALAQLLWRSEALEEMKARGLARGLSRQYRDEVVLALSQCVPVGELRGIVHARIKARADWRDGR